MAALLIVDGLSAGVTPAQLCLRFGLYGEVHWARIVTDHYGRSLAFGYVEMGSIEAANEAKRALDGCIIINVPIRVEHAIPEDIAHQAFTLLANCS
jgi:RNA recognition motif-containing protein